MLQIKTTYISTNIGLSDKNRLILGRRSTKEKLNYQIDSRIDVYQYQHQSMVKSYSKLICALLLLRASIYALSVLVFQVTTKEDK